MEYQKSLEDFREGYGIPKSLEDFREGYGIPKKS